MEVKPLLLSMISLGAILCLNQVAVSADKVKVNSFLMTKRKIATYNSKKTISITIPKGTTAQVVKVKQANGKKYVSLDLDRLSYAVRKPLVTKQSASGSSRWILAKGKNFTQVKKPAYLDYYSIKAAQSGLRLKTYLANGNLWKGTSLPATYEQSTNQRVAVTTDGHLEYYAASPYQYAVSPKPTQTAVIWKATHSSGSNNTYLYVHTGFKQLPFKKVAKTGDFRYRLTLNRLHQNTVTAIPNSDQAQRVMLNEAYKVGSQSYFMMVEDAHFLGEN